MYKFSINKDLFEDILLKKVNILEKQSSNYWKNELFEPVIINDKLSYQIRQFEKLILTNGLGNSKPQLIIECLEVKYFEEKKIFEFYLGKIIEQKNITVQDEYKDKIIEQLLEENKQLKEKVKLVQQKIIF
jgi:hypothetical protein